MELHEDDCVFIFSEFELWQAFTSTPKTFSGHFQGSCSNRNFWLSFITEYLHNLFWLWFFGPSRQNADSPYVSSYIDAGVGCKNVFSILTSLSWPEIFSFLTDTVKKNGDSGLKHCNTILVTFFIATKEKTHNKT